MPPFRHWVDLPLELLYHICDGLDLQSYVSARGVCTAWRRALVPPTPSLLVVPDHARRSLSAASLRTHQSFGLNDIPSEQGCVFGSSNGWLALSFDGKGTWFSLFNPLTATEIILPPLTYTGREISKSKIVFAPNPAADDFVAAAILGLDSVAYVTAGAWRWAILHPVRLAVGDRLVDLFYHHEDGLVYYLTQYGDVHVLRLPKRHHQKSILVEDPSPKPQKPSLLSSTEPSQWMSQCQRQQRRYMRFRAAGLTYVRPRSVELIEAYPPATLEPLLSVGNIPVNPATSFASPYDKLTFFTSAKNLVFCEGNLYQIWRNTTCTMNLLLPGSGCHRLENGQVFVFRYHPRHKPCWDVVADLAGFSVFLGRNNAVSMYSQGVAGLKGNCVYWIDEYRRDEGMVFDMATGRSTPCLVPAQGGASQRTICWYFLSGMVNDCNNNGDSISDRCNIVKAN